MIVSKAVFILLNALFLLEGAFAQELRCDLVSENCLDYSDSATVSITLPSNTTRIARDGLRVCLSAIEFNEPVDIVFVLDQSGSMADLNPDFPDNDPNFDTPKATTTALNLIHQQAPASHVGLLGFANGLCDGTQKNGHGKGPRNTNPPNTLVPPALINAPNHLNSLLAQVDYNPDNYYHNCGDRDSTGTSYYHAILKAKEWLADPTLAPHKNKFIIFLTDGVPNTPSLTQFQALVAGADSTNFARVFAVFINGSQGDLELLTRKTGGAFYKNAQTSAIEGIFQKIIQQTVIPNKPVATNVNNTSNSSSALSTSHNPAAADTNTFSILLDGEVALLENANSVSFSTSSTYKPNEPYKKDIMLSVNGAAATAKGKVKLPSPLFDLMCYDKSTIVPVDDKGTVLKEFFHTNEKLNAVLRTTPGIPSPVSNLKGQVDEENLALALTGPGVFGGSIPFQSTLSTSGNGTLEAAAGENLLLSWVHPRDPRDKAEYTLPVVLNFPVAHAWIKDADLDGRADRVFIRLKKPGNQLPDSITNITWPGNQSPSKKVYLLQNTPELSLIQWGDAQKTLLVADLSSMQFEAGKTSADPVNPPTALIQGETMALLEDSVGAVLISAVKLPSDFKLYARVENCSAFVFPNNSQPRSDCKVDVQPDTLEIILSEPLAPEAGALEPWKTLLYFYPAGNRNNPPLPVNVVGPPNVVSADQLTWRLPVSNKPSGQNRTVLKTDDVVLLNPAAPYTDAAGNSPTPKVEVVKGRDGEKSDVAYQFRRPVTGHLWYPTSATFPDNVPIIDKSGLTVGTLDAMEISVWVPPVGLNASGMVDDVTSACPVDIGVQQIFPENCLSSLLIKTAITDGHYTAYITIFDHYGTFIRKFSQKFGWCGELDNLQRIVSGRVVNDIVWNQKDEKGDLVGSGVYIWKITLQFWNGRKIDLMKRQGIARQEPPQFNCVGL